MARPPKIVPLEKIATDAHGNIVEFNTSARTIPVPEDSSESYRVAIELCRQTAVALNVQGNSEAAWWLAQADTYEREMAKKFGHAGMDREWTEADDMAHALPKPVASSSSGLVKLFGRRDKPIVRKKHKSTLTNPQYDTVLALLNAGDTGLTKDALDRESKRGDARKILKRLAESDPDWEWAISFPGRAGRGYYIK